MGISVVTARKRALKHTKNQPVYHSQRKRSLAVDLCKVTEMGSFPKVPAFGLSKPATLLVCACLAGTRQGSRPMRMRLKADVKGRMPCSDGIAVISILCICGCMCVCVKSNPGKGSCFGICPFV